MSTIKIQIWEIEHWPYGKVRVNMYSAQLINQETNLTMFQNKSHQQTLKEYGHISITVTVLQRKRLLHLLNLVKVNQKS